MRNRIPLAIHSAQIQRIVEMTVNDKRLIYNCLGSINSLYRKARIGDSLAMLRLFDAFKAVIDTQENLTSQLTALNQADNTDSGELLPVLEISLIITNPVAWQLTQLLIQGDNFFITLERARFGLNTLSKKQYKAHNDQALRQLKKLIGSVINARSWHYEMTDTDKKKLQMAVNHAAMPCLVF